MLQGTLFGTLPFGLVDVSERVRRTMLDDECWIDHVDGWVTGADDLYLELRRALNWRSHRRWIQDHEVLEPRLSTGITLPSPELCRMATMLDRHYGLGFIASWANLYRDGSDSVAWNGDRFRPGAGHETVALVSEGLSNQKAHVVRNWPFASAEPSSAGSSVSTQLSTRRLSKQTVMRTCNSGSTRGLST